MTWRTLGAIGMIACLGFSCKPRQSTGSQQKEFAVQSKKDDSVYFMIQSLTGKADWDDVLVYRCPVSINNPPDCVSLAAKASEAGKSVYLKLTKDKFQEGLTESARAHKILLSDDEKESITRRIATLAASEKMLDLRTSDAFTSVFSDPRQADMIKEALAVNRLFSFEMHLKRGADWNCSRTVSLSPVSGSGDRPESQGFSCTKYPNDSVVRFCNVDFDRKSPNAPWTVEKRVSEWHSMTSSDLKGPFVSGADKWSLYSGSDTSNEPGLSEQYLSTFLSGLCSTATEPNSIEVSRHISRTEIKDICEYSVFKSGQSPFRWQLECAYANCNVVKRAGESELILSAGGKQLNRVKDSGVEFYTQAKELIRACVAERNPRGYDK